MLFLPGTLYYLCVFVLFLQGLYVQNAIGHISRLFFETKPKILSPINNLP